MKERCIATDELESVLQLDPTSTRRRHVEECPRCRSLLAVYKEFLEDRSAPPGADVGDAASRLRARFAAALLEPLATRSAVTRDRPPLTVSLARLARPALRPAWILVALLLVVAGIYGGHEILGDRRAPSRLRTAPGLAGEESAGRLTLMATKLHSDGSLELRWRRASGADSYEVRVYGPDLLVAACFEAGADTVLIVSAERLRASLPAPGLAGIQVAGLHMGRETASSAIVAVDAAVGGNR